MTSIVTLTPTAQYVGTLNDSRTAVETPAVFGSVADGSDATFVEIEAQLSNTDNLYHTGMVSADFQIDASMGPAFMYASIRAKDAAAFVSNPAGIAIRTMWFRSDDAVGNPFDEWDGLAGTGVQLGDLAGGTVTTPTWLNFYRVGSTTPVDTANPSSSSWLALGPDGGSVGTAAYDALTTTGLRFSMSVQVNSNLTPRQAYLDIYEIRVVVACAPSAPTGIPAIRHMQRGDGELLSTAPRAFQHNSVQGSLRNLSYL